MLNIYCNIYIYSEISAATLTIAKKKDIVANAVPLLGIQYGTKMFG